MMNRRGLLGLFAAAPILARLPPSSPISVEPADYVRVSPTGSRLTIKKNVIEVRDAQGVLRVRLGVWGDNRPPRQHPGPSSAGYDAAQRLQLLS